MTRPTISTTPAAVTAALALILPGTAIASPEPDTAPATTPTTDATPEQRARALESEGKLLDAADTWARIADDPALAIDRRRKAAYEAQGAYRLEYTRRRQATSLCAALALLDGFLESSGPQLARAQLAEFEDYRATVRSQLRVHERVHGSVPCAERLDPPPLSPVPAPAPATSPADATTDTPPPESTKPGRPLVIAGGVSLSAAIVLLGVATYGIVDGARTAADIRELTDEARPGGGFDPDTWTTVEELYADGKTADTLAIATGIAGGALLVTGLTLVIVGAKRKRAAHALRPAVAPGYAGMSVRWRF